MKYVTLNGLQHALSKTKKYIDENIIQYEEIIYTELVALRNNSELKPGRFYRIIDYVTTVSSDIKNAQSAGHQFDIIVLALTNNILSEEAYARVHEGDEYFTTENPLGVIPNLNAWKIWYCIDNDKSRFDWADDVNGKGVIYRMIDEYNNDCPYDFKNIMYVGIADYPVYTFNLSLSSDTESIESIDMSLISYVNNNYIAPNSYKIITSGDTPQLIYYNDYGYSTMALNLISINATNCNNNYFGPNCYGITAGYVTGLTTDQTIFRNNFFESNIYMVYMGNNVISNEFSKNTFVIRVGDYIMNNKFGCNIGYIIFGESNDNLKSYIQHITIPEGAYNLTIGTSQTTSSSKFLQNVNVHKGTSSSTIDIGVVGQNYQIEVAKDSSGAIKQYCAADLIA